MKKALGIYLAAAMTVGTALSQNAPGVAEPTLQAGIKQFSDGDLGGAVFSLEAVIRSLSLEPAMHAKELSQAYLYRGAAFVGLSQEENAKGSFAAALQYDRTLRIGEDKFSPRVVRVFEAARTGKTKSVLLPPSNVAKKAGISALGIAGIVGGVAAIGGGVAAATHSAPTPVPTPRPVLTLISSTPPPGSTITVPPGRNPTVPLTLTVQLLFSVPPLPVEFEVLFFKDQFSCIHDTVPRSISPVVGQPMVLTIGNFVYFTDDSHCPLPITTTRVVGYMQDSSGTNIIQSPEVSASYNFVR